MIPKIGPSLWTVANLNDQVIAHGGGVLGPKKFLFPKQAFVCGLCILPTSGLRADMAALTVRIVDEDQDEMIADGLGNHTASLLTLFGTTVLGPCFDDLVLKRPFILQRPVQQGDEWNFTITNNHAAHDISVEAVIYFEEAEARAA